MSRNPDDLDVLLPPGDFGEVRFDLDFADLDFDEDIVTYNTDSQGLRDIYGGPAKAELPITGAGSR